MSHLRQDLWIQDRTIQPPENTVESQKWTSSSASMDNYKQASKCVCSSCVCVLCVLCTPVEVCMCQILFCVCASVCVCVCVCWCVYVLEYVCLPLCVCVHACMSGR